MQDGGATGGKHPALHLSATNTAADILSGAGLLALAQQLLTVEPQRSPTPLYVLHHLAALARKRVDLARTIGWYERTWEHATDPATC